MIPRKDLIIMKIVVCIGSSCHIKGSRQVVSELERLINESGLAEQVTLDGTFCLGNCQNGVSVTVDGTPLSVSPDNVEEFFKNEVLSRL